MPLWLYVEGEEKQRLEEQEGRQRIATVKIAWVQGENKSETSIGSAPYSLYRFVFRKIRILHLLVA